MRTLLFALCLTGLLVSGCYDFSIFAQTDPIDSAVTPTIDGAAPAPILDLSTPLPTGWIPLASSPGPQELWAVWGTTPSDVYVSGDNSLVAHWNGSAWTPLTVPGSIGAIALEGIAGSSSNDVWVVGEQGVALHSNGGGFTQSMTTVTAELYGVWESPDGKHVFAVGASGTVLHFHDGLWVDETNFAGAAPNRLIAITGGTSGADTWVYAVGDAGTSIRAKVVNVPVWQVATVNGGEELDAVWSDGKSVFAGGQSGQLIHSEDHGASFSSPDKPFDPLTRTFFGMWGATEKNVFAVGGEGAIARWDGMAWSTHENSLTHVELRAIWGSGAEAFVVGASGTVLHRTF